MIKKAKALFFAALLALFGAAPARASAPEAGEPALSLSAEIVGRRYCAGERLHILQLSVRLRYRNTGGRKLFVYRGKNLFYQTRVRGGAGGAQAKPYEVVVLNSRYNDAEPEAVNAPRPGPAFVALAPGAEYETVIVVGVGVAPGGAERAANSISPGEHTLQVVASSWYESRKLGEELRGRWRAAGLLWLDPLATPPLKFVAGGDGPVTPCR